DGAAVAEGALVASPPSLSSSPPHAASTSANAAAAAQRRVRRPRFTRAVLLVLTGTPSPRARPGQPSTHLLKTVEIFALDCKHELGGSARMRSDDERRGNGRWRRATPGDRAHQRVDHHT